MPAMLALSLALAMPAAAQEAPPPNHLAALQGGYHHVESEATGRSYHVYVRLPEGYAGGEETYPTVYLLDGDATFPMLAPAHLLLHYEDKLPEAIIVGIAYGTFGEGNHRGLDFTTTAIPDNPEGGQAPLFQRFLHEEVAPLIESRYRSDPERRILLGNSRGANYVLFDAFTTPDFFWARIASNPSTAPDGDKWLDEPATATRADLHLAMTSADGDHPPFRAYARRWMGHWSEAENTPWTVHAIDVPDATHAADIPRAYRAAMRRFFTDVAE
ncbi:alpha/beta hydrolase [Sphingomicrobium arenosum]|uniref:alpha/beta hydrolase n=1 Tax=Sphingomicrobium arenosum TaxID=2233861 RepID=UPI00223F911C|nr:alpha/beta hydrolase-fold protein [Sphingomicrobium arenosum]